MNDMKQRDKNNFEDALCGDEAITIWTFSPRFYDIWETRLIEIAGSVFLGGNGIKRGYRLLLSFNHFNQTKGKTDIIYRSQK